MSGGLGPRHGVEWCRVAGNTIDPLEYLARFGATRLGDEAFLARAPADKIEHQLDEAAAGVDRIRQILGRP